MAWTDDQWELLLSLLEHGFKARDPLTPPEIRAYRILMDRVEPEAATAALQELVLKAQVFRPVPGEIVAQARHDASVPTFDEAFALIFGRGGALKARRPAGVYADASAMARADDAAVWARLEGRHPLVVAFVQRQGLDRLRQMPVDDPDEGMWRRKELREGWELHVDAFDGREVTAIVAGSGREGLRRLDPLAGLPGQLPATRDELEAGSRS